MLGNVVGLRVKGKNVTPWVFRNKEVGVACLQERFGTVFDREPVVCRHQGLQARLIRDQSCALLAWSLRASSICVYKADSSRSVETRSSRTWLRIRTWTSVSTAAVNRKTMATMDTRSLVRRCRNSRFGTFKNLKNLNRHRHET